VHGVDAGEDFRRFVVGRQRQLLRTAWLLTGDWASAEDLVQTTLIAAWPRWGRISSTANPDAYVRRILVNKSHDWRRRRWHGEIPTATLPEGPVVDDPHAELTQILVQALRALPARQRTVMVLRYFDDLTEVETAAAMDCAVGTVKSQSSKALASLRRHPALADLQLEGRPS
jgi:RNA polymerase sigma-70 factor (sigma-E family)